ncbi:MAG: tRNA (adenosine(37)-N6)-dimethylallyltransferase MiaA [Ignavibacteriales bacterium]|nr:MAG: tRNA (adenosine(37)-N6)-dimethylallyltransferase MiaA [Ignavibacteriales bacterium]
MCPDRNTIKNNYNLITILGPTAVGKTRLAALIANRINAEIISADSRQVYKGMDIGTGKDLQDYFVNNHAVNYHLIDIAEPTEEYNLFRFVNDFQNAFNKINSVNRIPILCGGTGLYLNAIIRNYSLKESPPDKELQNLLRSLPTEELKERLFKLNPALHNTTDLLDKERLIRAIEIAGTSDKSVTQLNINSLVIGVKLERSIIKERITNRLKLRFENGMIDEVKKLAESGLSFEKLNFFGLEYRYIGLYLQGQLSYDEMFEKLNYAIHNFAKRQMTWFRKMEKEGVNINWIDGADLEKALRIIQEKFYPLV